MPVRMNDIELEDSLADLQMPRGWLITKLRDALLDLKELRASTRAKHGWLVQKKRGKILYYLGVKEGRPYWTAESGLAILFSRADDARGIADCIRSEGVTTAEHYWS